MIVSGYNISSGTSPGVKRIHIASQKLTSADKANPITAFSKQVLWYTIEAPAATLGMTMGFENGGLMTDYALSFALYGVSEEIFDYANRMQTSSALSVVVEDVNGLYVYLGDLGAGINNVSFSSNATQVDIQITSQSAGSVRVVNSTLIDSQTEFEGLTDESGNLLTDEAGAVLLGLLL